MAFFKAEESTLQRVTRLAERVQCEPYRFLVTGIQGARNRTIIQAMLWRVDLDDPEHPYGWGTGGEYLVSAHDSDDAIFKRFFVAARDYGEHETREAFRIDGKRVFDPHMPMSTLMRVAKGD